MDKTSHHITFHIVFFGTPFGTPKPAWLARIVNNSLIFLGEPVGIRTRDLLIKSQLLYRLSYGLATAVRNIRGAGDPVNRPREKE